MIRFRKVSRYGHKVNTDWQYAKDEKELIRKMGPHCLAELTIPKWKKWFYKIFPVRSYDKGQLTYHIHNGKVTVETC